MEKKFGNKVILGIALIIVGLFSLLNFYFNIEGILPLIISLAALGLYVYFGYNKRYSNLWLIMVSVFVFTGQLSEWLETMAWYSSVEDWLMTGIVATDFLLIYLVHTRVFKDRSESSRKWPLIPSGILYAITVYQLVSETISPKLGEMMEQVFWPLVIIAIGVLLLIQGAFSKKKRAEGQEKEWTVNVETDHKEE